MSTSSTSIRPPPAPGLGTRYDCGLASLGRRTAAAGIAVLTPHLRFRSQRTWIVGNAVAVTYWSAHVIVLTPPWFAFQGQLEVIRAAALGALAAGALVSVLLWRAAPGRR